MRLSKAVSAKHEIHTVVLASLILGSWACGGAKPPPAQSPEARTSEPEVSAPARPTPQASPLVREGEALLAKGDAAAAKAKFEAQLATHKDDVRAWLGLGLAEEVLGDVKAAEKAYREAIAVDGSFAEAHNNLALLLRDADRLPEAVTELEQAVHADPKLASARTNLAMAYEDEGRAGDANEAYAAAVKLTPDDAMLRLNYGLFLLGQGDAESDHALAELRAAQAKARGDRAVLVGVGNGLRRAGKPNEAVRALEAAIQGGDGKPTPALLSELALAQHAAGMSPEAKASLEQALRLDPKYASAHYVLASMLASEGNKRGAMDHYQRCIDADPKGPLAEKAREKLKVVKAMR
jgi:Tfp pilus assembly protein PilF